MSDVANARAALTSMSLRDWFAGQALAGIIGHMPAEAVADITQGIPVGMPIAYGAYALADAMLALRQARPPPPPPSGSPFRNAGNASRPATSPQRIFDMGMHALVIDAEEAKLSAAVEAANRWVAVATPVMKAYLAIDMIDGDLRCAEIDARGDRKWGSSRNYAETALYGARSDVQTAVGKLYDAIVSIHDDLLNDEKLNTTDGANDDEWDRVEAFNEELERQCVGVDAAIKAAGQAL